MQNRYWTNKLPGGEGKMVLPSKGSLSDTLAIRVGKGVWGQNSGVVGSTKEVFPPTAEQGEPAKDTGGCPTLRVEAKGKEMKLETTTNPCVIKRTQKGTDKRE